MKYLKTIGWSVLLLVISTLTGCTKHPTCPGGDRRILFDSGSYYKTEIYTICADGTNLKQHTHTGDFVRNFDATWSPDGSKIVSCRAYWTEWDPGWGAMYLMDAEGSNEEKLRDGGGYPLFSPDGRKIAFWWNHGLYTMNPDGSEELRLLTDEGAEPVHGYSWSPDGSQIVYCTQDKRICKVYSDRTGRQELVAGAMEPRWSPDGSLIAFASHPGSDPWLVNIFVMNPDGSDKRRLTDFSTLFQTAHWPVWSPDGSRILFSVYDMEQRRTSIHIMNKDGSGRKRLTDNNDVQPAWSPDGSQIAYMSDQRPAGYWQIWVMDADGSDQTKLTSIGGECGHPAWQP